MTALLDVAGVTVRFGGLTALNDGLRAENARVTAELAVHVERAATASPQKRTRATAAAR